LAELGETLGGYPLKTIGLDQTHIDYFQGVNGPQDGLSNLVGIRMREEYYLVIVKNRDGQVYPSGDEFHAPVRLEMLPSHVRQIVEDHLLNFPTSDLMAVLTGTKSFQQALESPPKVKTANDRRST
jgi:hypothetical protein